MVVRWLHLPARSLAIAIAFVTSFSALEPAVIAQESVPVSSNSGRRLSTDAYFVIPSAAEVGETFEGPVELPLAASDSDLEWPASKFPEGRPHYAPASDTLLEMKKSVIFRHEVWAMEFGFKPVRMIAVDVPKEDGGFETKLVWYLLYYVRYRGGDLTPTATKDEFGNEVFGVPAVSPGKEYRRFIPGFVMNCKDLVGDDGKPHDERVQSSFIPHALPLIAEKERVGKPVYDTIAIQKVPIPLSTNRESHPVWGVATWTDIDPRTDFFSVEVRGLTNAQRTENVKDKKELVFQQKTLVLNFSRPGDAINQLEDRIRYGVPAISDPEKQNAILSKYGLKERLDHYWVYR